MLFAVGDAAEPMWLLAAIKPHDEAYDYAQTLTLKVNPANGAMEVLRGAAIGAKVERVPQPPHRPGRRPGPPVHRRRAHRAGIDAEVAAEAVRLTSDDDILDLAADLPEWQQRVLMELATGTSLDDVRDAYELDQPRQPTTTRWRR